MTEAQSKTQPHNLQAEQCVLACLMLDYVGCSDGLEKLGKSDFFSPVHQTIFGAMTELTEKKDKIIDFITVTEALSSKGKLDAIGGVAYLNTINDMVPSVVNFRQYFDIVKKNSVLRKLGAAAKKILDSSFASDDEAVTLSEAEKAIFDISREDEHKELTPISDELPAVMNRLDTIRRDPTALYGVQTGFYDIDKITNGFHSGELIILAARPGIGKTSLGLNMIMNAALNTEKKCAIFSLEMNKESLTQRAICSLAKVSSYKAGRGELSEKEWARLFKATDILSKASIYIDDNSEIGHSEIKRKCMRLKREQGLDFIMVDYLGLMNAGTANKYDNRQVEVAANSRAMKILAKELEIPVLLIAQLNRNVETRSRKGDNAIPELYDLRESGAIEQDADIVMFIHMNKPSESEEIEDNSVQEAYVKIAKHRNGPVGTVKLEWHKETTTFTNQQVAQAAQDARDAIKPQN